MLLELSKKENVEGLLDMCGMGNKHHELDVVVFEDLLDCFGQVAVVPINVEDRWCTRRESQLASTFTHLRNQSLLRMCHNLLEDTLRRPAFRRGTPVEVVDNFFRKWRQFFPRRDHPGF